MSRRLPLFVSLIAILGACASATDLRRQFMAEYRDGHYEQAETTLVTTAGKDEKDFLVDVLDRAMVLNHQGRYRESNEFLERADQKIEEMYTQKVSDALAALAWNDTAATYQGEDYERVMVDVAQAFNYLALGQRDEALVEARQVSRKMETRVAWLKEHEVDTKYRRDPFALYVAALLQESAGDHDAAYLAYEQAWGAYEELASAYHVGPPPELARDLARAATRAGRVEQAERWRAQAAGDDPLAAPGASEVVVIVGLGLVAHKESNKWVAFDGQDTIAVTYPEYRATTTRVTHAEVWVSGATQPFAAWTRHDLSTLATGVMAERNEALKDRAIAAGIARYIAKKMARAIGQSSRNQGVQLAAALFTLGTTVKELAEVADTRSWRTLPDRYAVARVAVPPGVQDVDVLFRDGWGNVVSRVPCRVQVPAGGKAFVVAHSSDAPGRWAPNGPVPPAQRLLFGVPDDALAAAPALPMAEPPLVVAPPTPPAGVPAGPSEPAAAPAPAPAPALPAPSNVEGAPAAPPAPAAAPTPAGPERGTLEPLAPAPTAAPAPAPTAPEKGKLEPLDPAPVPAPAEKGQLEPLDPALLSAPPAN